MGQNLFNIMCHIPCHLNYPNKNHGFQKPDDLKEFLNSTTTIINGNKIWVVRFKSNYHVTFWIFRRCQVHSSRNIRQYLL